MVTSYEHLCFLSGHQVDLWNRYLSSLLNHVNSVVSLTFDLECNIGTGCMFGALSCLYGGDRLGRRKVIFLGAIIMVIGACLQSTAFSLAHFIIGRIVTGYGNGFITATVPIWQSWVHDGEHRAYPPISSNSQNSRWLSPKTFTYILLPSECSKPHKRGKLVMIEGALITGGICLSYWIDMSSLSHLFS